MLYGAESWGTIKSKLCEDIQYRAIRFFMGVHKTTSLAAMRGEMGWEDINISQKIYMLRFWNRLIQMDNSRITKQIFLWDYSLSNKTWCSDICCIYIYRC